MFSVNDFFTILQFFRENKNVIGVEAGEYSGSICPNGTTSVNGLCISSDTQDIDSTIIQTAVNTKLQTIKYFNAAMDSPAFNDPHYNKLRRLIIDWHSTNKTFTSLQKISSNPLSLDSTLLEYALRSFGFPYGSLIAKKDTKAQFLLALANLYKSKGTPQTLIDALKFFGFPNLRLYEWWVVRNDQTVFFEGKKLDTGGTLESAFPDRRYLEFDEFLKLSDPHWFYTQQQILDIDLDPVKGLIGLPSITPYFSIATVADLKGIDRSYTILSRLLKDQYESYINGGNVPKDIYIDVAGFSTSLISLFLSILYCWWNYNDFLKYTKLRNYIIEEFSIVPELDDDPFIVESPNLYEKLLFWTITREDSTGSADPLDITATGFLLSFPDTVDKFTDLPVSANEHDTILVTSGVSGYYELYRYESGSWVLQQTYTQGLGASKGPKSGIGFVLYPTTVESYIQEVDVSGGRSDLSLDYDESIIKHDEQAFYPLLNNKKVPSLTDKYLYAQDINIPVYNQDYNILPGFSTAIETALERFDEINQRPNDYDDAKTKLEDHSDEFTRPQILNFLQNRFDPQRILQGSSPVQTVADLPLTADENSYKLVYTGVSGDPEVYKFTSGSWVFIEDGLLIGDLGLHQELKDYIDSIVGEDKYQYETVIEDLLIELDTFASTLIGRTPIDLKQLAMGIPNLGNSLMPVVDFFKPLRARFLSYELVHQIQDPVGDSVNLKDSFLIIQTINIPESGPETVRGQMPEDYDVYPYGHDSSFIYDDIEINVTENGLPVSQNDWY